MGIKNNIIKGENVSIFPGAYLIGDVEIGSNSSVWYNAVIRADIEKITIGKNSNIQDNSVIHVTKNCPVTIKDNVTIGHGAVIHGCRIDDNVLVGMSSTILNNAHIGKNSIVGAGALITENKEFPENSLIVGFPAKAVRTLTDEEIKGIKENADAYSKISKAYDL